jgi:hypothetical protein
MTYRDQRFEGSKRPPGSRQPLSFVDRVVHIGTIRDDWDFIDDSTLRSNIAAELQKVHFDLLLLNEYNVYWAPEAMTLKHAIIAIASVAEAVLEVEVRMLRDHPDVRPLLEKRDWIIEELHTIKGAGVEIPDGVRIVSAVQREVIRDKFDKNTKMELLIRAARVGGAIDEQMAEKLNRLRELRNRVHIKCLEELEYDKYKHEMANDALGILEEFRVVAKAWIETVRQEDIAALLAGRTSVTIVSTDDDIFDTTQSVPVGSYFYSGGIEEPDYGPPDVEEPDYGPPELAEPDFGPPDDIPW